MDKRRLRIRDLMNRQDLSYRQLATLTGIPSSVLQRYVTNNTNKMSIDYFGLIANALGVSPIYLMGWSDDEHYSIEKPAKEEPANTPSPIQQIFDSLNEEGQDKLIEYGNDLAALPKYKKCDMAAQQDIG